MYAELYEHSKELMKRPGVRLSKEAQRVACLKMVEALRFHQVLVVDVCVGARHFHVLGQFYPMSSLAWSVIRAEGRSIDRSPKHLLGIAKKEIARELSRAGLAQPGGVWAIGCGRRWIKNQAHFDRLKEYIQRHAEQGAVVWSIHLQNSEN